jgi:hypothetical protein
LVVGSNPARGAVFPAFSVWSVVRRTF